VQVEVGSLATCINCLSSRRYHHIDSSEHALLGEDDDRLVSMSDRKSKAGVKNASSNASLDLLVAMRNGPLVAAAISRNVESDGLVDVFLARGCGYEKIRDRRNGASCRMDQ
jgi:hypothetical protein